MGALAVALGSPSFHLNLARVSPSIRRLPGRSAQRFSYSHSLVAKDLRCHRFRRTDHDHDSHAQLGCSASASWPYESWATEDSKEGSNRPWIGFLEQDVGFEVLAMGFGVVVSVVLAVSKQGAPGVPVGVLSLAFLTVATIALRHQVATLCGALISQFNAIQAAMAVHLSSMHNNVIIWGTRSGASVHSPPVPIREVELAPPMTREPLVKRHEEDSREESKGLSSTEIEAALRDIAKSVAQLTMVVANLDSKISSLEKVAPSHESGFGSSTLEASQNNKIVDDAATSPAFTEAEPKQNGIYKIQKSVVDENVAQLKWEEAVFKDKSIYQTKSQLLKGCKPSEAPLASNKVDVFSEYESKASGDEVSLRESSPVDILPDLGSSRKNLSQSAPSKFSRAETRDTSMEWSFQDGGVGDPEGVVVSAGEALTQSKQDVADVEAMELFFQAAGVTNPQRDSKDIVQNIVVEDVAQPQLLNPKLVSSVHSEALDNIVKDKTVQGRERIYNVSDAHREEASGRRASRDAIDRSREYELDGSESYRAVPTTMGYRGDGNQRTGSKPDVLRLKRIMSGAESRYTDGPSSQPNAWIQNDAIVSDKTWSKETSKEKPALVFSTQSDAGWDQYSVSRSSGNDWADEDARANDSVGTGRGATRSQGVKGESSYDGQGQSSRRRPRPEGSEEISSSSKADYGQRWRREDSSGVTDADFGGNGSSSDTNEGGNGSRRRQSSSRSSYDSDEDRDLESPTSQDRRPSPASPSYPSERTETFRNLPGPKPDDEEFQKILDEVEALLKEGREGLEGRIEVGVAEPMLYEAAELCEKAVELRPSSLIAVGMWGNTLLLHGELKLRLSQNLRSMMPEPPSKSLSRREFREVEEDIQSYEATLQDVGEECEQLLVEAGRKYRLALSMDRTDMRALYNWGLALCYRGQLIAEEGGETAAQDADKVFLAAIDKFEAMMGLSDMYAAGALLNWGLAMRDRSRLRPLGSKERQRIMAQAKEIFEEAVRLDPNYGQARGAVAACIVELKRLQEYKEEPQESKESPPSRGFRDWWG